MAGSVECRSLYQVQRLSLVSGARKGYRTAALALDKTFRYFEINTGRDKSTSGCIVDSDGRSEGAVPVLCVTTV